MKGARPHNGPRAAWAHFVCNSVSRNNVTHARRNGGLTKEITITITDEKITLPKKRTRSARESENNVTKKKTVTNIPPEETSAAELAAAEKALRGAEGCSAHWHEMAARLAGSASADDPETIAELNNARTSAETADRDLERRRAEYDAAEAAHRDAVRRATLARLTVDPDLTGQSERETVATLEASIAKATEAARVRLSAIRDRQVAAAQEAADAGLPVAPAGYVGADGRGVSGGSQLLAVPGQGVALVGRRVTGPLDVDRILADVLAGRLTAEDVPLAVVPETADKVRAEDAETARALLTDAYGTDVRPLPERDPLGQGVWARITAFDASDGNGIVSVSADVIAVGVHLPKDTRPGAAPHQVGGAAILQWHTTEDVSGASRITARIVTPALANGAIYPNTVGRYVSLALAEVDTAEWPSVLRRDMAYFDTAPYAAVTVLSEDRVNLRFHLAHDGAPCPVILPGSIVKRVLTGLVVPGAGAVADVEITNGGHAAVLTFATEAADAA